MNIHKNNPSLPIFHIFISLMYHSDKFSTENILGFSATSIEILVLLQVTHWVFPQLCFFLFTYIFVANREIFAVWCIFTKSLNRPSRIIFIRNFKEKVDDKNHLFLVFCLFYLLFTSFLLCFSFTTLIFDMYRIPIRINFENISIIQMGLSLTIPLFISIKKLIAPSEQFQILFEYRFQIILNFFWVFSLNF